ncbi:broad-complex core protein isoforms 1/2/3/4/5 [Stomoxys calcitrans]|uniref:broad-complex core protein isoforms 1/2/3/4/5 n=1 Tax=Stomoxys calcitrans TaxID=35570 RepID=UPI0027E2B536|nr:broad-complex core protein isoforms 1/2/3/4/5 [Stomoxys calcitrans]XP_013105212.2 broad-complex core protein isoforms 1/2/3/4/5 [Stomoxys calcitrans]XP_013105213.2 broad-complex core protein isoforms 1/2/3/4/5 [Stomoxys calcitrans]XP_059222875.1 broad-complex core protein isoforms 1/2/3/4/5 [Stomoxys calcitrans]
MLPQQYCLRWKYHHSNLQTMFSQLLDRGCFCDVTLACDGQLIKAHRVVLCACSTFFDTILTNYSNERDPIIIMKDISFADIKCLIEFMYKGEINVEHANLASLLKTADDLKIKGLAEVTWRDDDDGPPPPTAQTEFHSPPISRSRQASHLYNPYGRDHQQRSHSPEGENKTPSPKHGTAMNARMPTLTPIPSTSTAISAVAAVSPNDAYLGPKRKRGRPPLDDSYDVFNVRKLAQYAHRGEQSPYLEAQYTDERSLLHHQHHHGTPNQHSRPNSPSAAEVYQHHVQQQKQRMRYRPHMQREQEQNSANDEPATEPEWITSSLEAERTKGPREQGDTEDILPHDSEEIVKIKTEEPSDDSTAEHPKVKETANKDSNEEESQQRSPQSAQPEEFETDEAANVPQTVEEMETKQQQQLLQQKQTAVETSTANNMTTTTSTSSSSATTNSSSSSSSSIATSHSTSLAAHKSSTSSSSTATTTSGHSHHHSSSTPSNSSASSSNPHHSSSSSSSAHGHHAIVPPPPLHHPHHHYGKYVPDGYMINEHGILMTHDFIHAPTATIPTSSSAPGASSSNGHNADDYNDIKMEDFNDADFRLTSEEMSEWQDVIKMDDYLAKGRRPQFWEEPFTRRVLDAIKNKRLEMKKAARILGVSYGTLYGRYREVYGCLKHPYSTSMRPYQSSGPMQHRFDIVWPSPKPGQMDIGKIRPKDLSELWTRPQM